MNETISLEELRVFLAIARANGITGAGKALGLPKAKVSKSLARLELHLGVQLFERSTRRLAITRAGSVLRARADGLLAEVETLITEVRSDVSELRGTLTIAAPPELGVLLTGGLFAHLLEAHPALRVSLRLDYAHHDLFDPEIDLAFRIGGVMDENLVQRVLGSFVRILVAAPSIAAAAKVRSPADLHRLPCLAFDEHGFGSTWALSDGKENRTVEVEGRLGARSYPALLSATLAGLGVANLPDFVVEEQLGRGMLVRVLPRWASPPLTLSLVHRVSQTRIRRVATFLAHLKAHPELLPSSIIRPPTVTETRRPR